MMNGVAAVAKLVDETVMDNELLTVSEHCLFECSVYWPSSTGQQTVHKVLKMVNSVLNIDTKQLCLLNTMHERIAIRSNL